jgi:glyceraldehyde 3-phosphate dehydrogenase
LGRQKKELVAYLFKYDSILGTYPGDVSLSDNDLYIDGIAIPVFNEINTELLPWKKFGIDWVVDCSGKYTKRQKAQEHLDGGAAAVLISAPGHDEDVMIIPGVNSSAFNYKKHKIVSLGSCTTNALMPLLKILYEYCGLQSAFMTTIHAYTNSQVLLDVNDHDARRSRAAPVNIIPTTTGASLSVAKVMPELEGKISGNAIRVPVDIVSLIDLSFESNKPLTVDFINETFRKAAEVSPLKNILTCTNQPLVSSDFKGNNSSVIFDETLTQVQGESGKIYGWYDNEWGYCQRLKDFLISIQ